LPQESTPLIAVPFAGINPSVFGFGTEAVPLEFAVSPRLRWASRRGALERPSGWALGPERSGWGFKGEWGWGVIPKER